VSHQVRQSATLDAVAADPRLEAIQSGAVAADRRPVDPLVGTLRSPGREMVT
jgi:hypothetical protein